MVNFFWFTEPFVLFSAILDAKLYFWNGYQVDTAQWLAWRLATGEVPLSNPGKEDNFINF